ncbi:uncharacterized protein LOC124418547 [Lucilia cuprina]|uniref:uncharacterized protein LOC124418547 n=1 Tax=Lucilia cuprina TaxID=7375 RepID=UPI001F06BA59|nr:uncharacterized protein LOC124418547 [Lucilia cuprina]
MPPQPRRSLSPLEEERNHIYRRTNSQRQYCRLCRKDHTLRKCLAFKRLNVSEKLKVVKRYRYCENCLADSHQISRCRNTDRCRQCGSRHHSLLHRHERLRTPRPNKPLNAGSSPYSSSRTVTFLPTIILKISLGNEWANVRGLLNPCAEVSTFVDFLVERYRIMEEKIGSDRWCTIKIRPRFEESPIFNVTAKVVNDLPRKMPKEQVDERVAELFTNLRLADLKFHRSTDINFVLGADIYPRLIKPGIHPATVGSPMAQDTILGWTIIGKLGV